MPPIINKHDKDFEQSTDVELESRVPCFGTSFSLQESMCLDLCPVRDRCVLRIARHYVPHLQHILRKELWDITELAEALETDASTARLIREVGQDPKKVSLLPSRAPVS